MGRLPGPGRYVTKHTMRGYAYQAWEPPMPRVPDEYLDCVIYLYASKPDAQNGVRSGGSGFMVAVPSERVPNGNYIYAVTNEHVISGGSTVVRLNTLDGKMDALDFTEQEWWAHPDGDDLAIALMPAMDATVFRSKWVAHQQLLTQEEADYYDVGPGDEPFVVGRFINHEGRQRNIPSLRFGFLAQMPLEPIQVPRGRGFFNQDCYLVDVKSIGGYSGSPVFLLPSIFNRRERPNVTLNKYWLLGIDWGNLCHWSPVCDENGDPLPQKFKVDVNTGMMVVVPAWKLLEMLFHPDIVRVRTESDNAWARERETPAVGANAVSLPKTGT